MSTQLFLPYHSSSSVSQARLNPNNPINPHASPQPEDDFWYIPEPRDDQVFGLPSIMSQHRLALLKLVRKKRKARNPNIEDLAANLEREQQERQHLMK